MASGHIGGREIKTIPGRVLFPLAELAANEDDESMQARWAALLARGSTDPDSIPPAFPRLLSEVSPSEARLLDYLLVQSPEQTTDVLQKNTMIFASILVRFTQ